MHIIHKILGAVILMADWLTSPKGIQRSKSSQALVDQQTKAITLYQFKACPFCVKVRRAIKRQSLAIETRDAKRCEKAKQALLAGGGKLKVPCLKVENDDGGTNWIYESTEIINYLEQRFARH